MFADAHGTLSQDTKYLIMRIDKRRTIIIITRTLSYCRVITGTRVSEVIWDCSYQSARVCLQFTEEVKISIV